MVRQGPAGRSFCVDCGATITPSARFCGACGSAVPETTAHDHRDEDRSHRRRASRSRGRTQRLLFASGTLLLTVLAIGLVILRTGTSRDNTLLTLLTRIPAEMHGAGGVVVVGDLERAWSAVGAERPPTGWDLDRDADAWRALYPLGAYPPGPLFFRATTRLQDFEFEETIGFGPADIDQFAYWSGDEYWVATTRLPTSEISSWLDDSPYWKRGSAAGWSADPDAAETRNPRGAIPPESFRHAQVTTQAGLVIVDRQQGRLQEARASSFADLPGVGKLSAALHDELVYGLIVGRELFQNLELPEDADALTGVRATALATVFRRQAVGVAVFVAHSNGSVAATNASALARNLRLVATDRGVNPDAVQVEIDGAVLRAEIPVGPSTPFRALTRLNFHWLSTAARD